MNDSGYQDRPRHHWDGYHHQTLYDRIHGNGGIFLDDGAGVSGATGAQEGWAELATLMAQARERTEAALARAGAVWEGCAADAMRSGITPLARWADDAYTASTASQGSTDAHVGSYASAKNRMPEPVTVTSTANSDFLGIPAGFTHLFGGQTDQDRQEAAAQEAKAEAVRIMTGYEDESGGARASLGQFVPPPSVTVDVSPGSTRSGDVIPVGASEPPPRSGQPGDEGARDTRGPGGAPPPGGGPEAPTGGAPPGGTFVPPGTNPSDVTTTPPVGKPPVPPVMPGLLPEQPRPGPVVPLPTGGFTTGGVPGERGAGGVGRGPSGRGFGESGGIGRGPGGAGIGRGPGEAGPGAGGARGVGVNESLAGRAGVSGVAGATGARGAGGMGMAPVGSRADGEEDKEHASPEYLRDYHDDFWDTSPPVAPPVIGDEDDD